MGADRGLVTIVTAVSATYPLIPVFGSVVLLGERPAPNQYVGVAMVIAGLMLLGVALSPRRSRVARGAGRTRAGSGASGVLPRIRSAAFSATIITGA